MPRRLYTDAFSVLLTTVQSNDIAYRICVSKLGDIFMKKYILIALAATIVMSVIIHTCVNRIMIGSVESVKNDLYNVVCGKKEKGIDYGALERYDYSRYFEIKTVDDLNLEIGSASHNSGEGYMNVVYSFELNKNDKEHTVGAGGVEARWYIRKDGDRWIVYDIEEAP